MVINLFMLLFMAPVCTYQCMKHFLRSFKQKQLDILYRHLCLSWQRPNRAFQLQEEGNTLDEIEMKRENRGMKRYYVCILVCMYIYVSSYIAFNFPGLLRLSVALYFLIYKVRAHSSDHLQ